jgi:hypothetical protein
VEVDVEVDADELEVDVGIEADPGDRGNDDADQAPEDGDDFTVA